MEITSTLIMTARAVSFLRRWLKAVASFTLTDWRIKSKPASPLKKQRSVFCMYMSIFASLRVKAKFIIFPSTPYQSDSPSESVAKLAALISFAPCQRWKGPQDSAITWAPETCQHPSAPRPAVLLKKQRSVWEAVALQRVCNQEKHSSFKVRSIGCRRPVMPLW